LQAKRQPRWILLQPIGRVVGPKLERVFASMLCRECIDTRKNSYYLLVSDIEPIELTDDRRRKAIAMDPAAQPPETIEFLSRVHWTGERHLLLNFRRSYSD
jgi:hypothetical protein